MAPNTNTYAEINSPTAFTFRPLYHHSERGRNVAPLHLHPHSSKQSHEHPYRQQADVDTPHTVEEERFDGEEGSVDRRGEVGAEAGG